MGCELDLGSEWGHIVLCDDIAHDGAQVLHVSRVGALTQQHKVRLGLGLHGLAGLALRDHQYLLEAHHFQQEACLRNVSKVLPDVGVRKPQLAVLLLLRVLQNVLDHGIHDLQ